MKQQKKSMLVLAMITAFITGGFFLSGLVGAGDLEPSASPGPTMKTLKIPPTWIQKLPADKRFQKVFCTTSEGGSLECAAVLDKETGLIWAADANMYGAVRWQWAIAYCADLSLGDRKGWRLPSREELASLLDTSQSNPTLPIGYDSFFSNVQDKYWSSTEYESNSIDAWAADIYYGFLRWASKSLTSSFHTWCVRGGN
jgi:hypothetical protein